MEHHYNVEIAKKYGIAEAVLLQNIYFWLSKNKVNNHNLMDGHYWTYNSARAFRELFPEMTQSKIYACLKRLEEQGVILSENYNKIAYDRTKWYALTELGWSLFDDVEFPEDGDESGKSKEEKPVANEDFHFTNQKMPFHESKNDISRIQEPIPDNKQQIVNQNENTDCETVNETELNTRARENHRNEHQGLSEYASGVFDEIWDRVPSDEKMSLGQTYSMQRMNSLDALASIISKAVGGVPNVPCQLFAKWVSDAIAMRRGKAKCISYALKDFSEQIAECCSRAYKIEMAWG